MQILKRIQYEPAKVSGGYTDNILRVDLGKSEILVEQLPPDFKQKYIGGRGYALKIIWDGTNAQTRYDSPDNILIMASGPLGNEPGFPGTSKFIVGTISPLTDTFIDSNIGGHFGPLLKLAGFDAVAISGISKEARILIIDGDAGTICLAAAPYFNEEVNAGALSYGETILKETNSGEYSDNYAAVTAGKGASSARFGIINSLFFDRRRKRIRCKQAGRGGTGTVMYTKGLRSIIVHSSLPKANGNNAIDKEGVRRAGTRLKKVIATVDTKQLNLSSWGTTGLSEYMDKFHLFPIKNYQYGQDQESSRLFASVFLDKYFSKNIPDGCYYGCNLACAKGAENVRLTIGPHAGKIVNIDGPEYETVAAVANMGIFNPQFVIEYNWYCDEYSLDTISTGVTIGFYMECVQRGFLTEEDIGYALNFGNSQAVERLLFEIIDAKGFGRIAAQGVSRGKQWVAEKYASRNGASKESTITELNKFGMEVKGLEFSMYITKESLAQQGGYGFALKGPQHDEAWLIFIDQVHKELPTLEQKANALKWFPLIRTWFNATGLCKLPWIDVRNPEAASTPEPFKNIPTLEYYVDYWNATTGDHKTLEDMLNDSERLYVLQKLINLRHGKGTRIHDQIPLRALGPVYSNEFEFRADYYDQWLRENLGQTNLPQSQKERHSLLIEKRMENFGQLCDMVYQKKGFTVDGIPTRETVEKFGLMDTQAKELLDQYLV